MKIFFSSLPHLLHITQECLEELVLVPVTSLLKVELKVHAVIVSHGLNAEILGAAVRAAAAALHALHTLVLAIHCNSYIFYFRKYIDYVIKDLFQACT